MLYALLLGVGSTICDTQTLYEESRGTDPGTALLPEGPHALTLSKRRGNKIQAIAEIRALREKRDHEYAFTT
jgi:hypothetical protein